MKTETTKILMGHMAAISNHTDAGSGRDDQTINAIIKANPLLESFGNAKTTRNDNSSRFGKFTRLQFDDRAVLSGARSNTYLLEKTRILQQAEGERNYHIMYQLLAASKAGKHGEIKIDGGGKAGTYRYLCESGFEYIEGQTDLEHYEETTMALTIIDVTRAEQNDLFAMIGAVLHMGQVEIQPKASNEDECEVATVAALLGRDGDALSKVLTSRTVTANRDTYEDPLPLSPGEGAACRDALAKAVYTAQFNWLVNRINQAISVNQESDKVANLISILGIFGFEHFKHNSYEQLCINYNIERGAPAAEGRGRVQDGAGGVRLGGAGGGDLVVVRHVQGQPGPARPDRGVDGT